MFHLPFLLISLTMFFIWSILLFFGQKTRREQIIMSIAGLILTPAILLVASSDYRAAGSLTSGFVGIEDFIFAFSFTGVTAVVYEILIGRRFIPIRQRHLGGHHPLHWLTAIIILLGSWAAISFATMMLFPIGSIYAFMIGALLVGTYVIADRHDLLIDAIFSGLFMAVLVFGLEQLFFVHLFPIEASALWQTDRLSGLFISGIPVEEIIWILIVGMTIGPVYEFVRHYQVK